MEKISEAEDLAQYASSLTDEELKRMRHDNYNVMRDLTGFVDAFEHHPLSGLWRGYEQSLLTLQYAICTEWHIVRGYDDDMVLRKTADLFWDCLRIDFEQEEPWWFAK